MTNDGKRFLPPRRRRLACLLATTLALSATAGLAQAAGTSRVSVDDAGLEANEESSFPALDQTGRTVAFSSRATNLVGAGDVNGARLDVFVHDRRLGVTTRVDVASDGSQADGSSVLPHLSRNGRLVSFASDATNLVAGDGNGARDVFVHDRKTGVTERVSVAGDGSEGNASSPFALLSGNGRIVAFQSSASNLVADDVNGESDLFVHDRKTGVTERINVNRAGAVANGVSMLSPYGALGANGRMIAFYSEATNLVAGDVNGVGDVFVRDRRSLETIRASVASDGSEANGPSGEATMSENGRFVAFVSEATNLVADDTNGLPDVFVHDLKTGATRRVSVATDGSEANGISTNATFSTDGRYVTFFSSASNLVADDVNGDYDVFVHDLKTGTTTRVSVGASGNEGNGASTLARISGNGHVVAFQSGATNLVTADVNGGDDIFVRDLK
jgi:Tol biopolymer transport system component